MTTSARTIGPIEAIVSSKLTKALSPITHMNIVNDSHKHNVPVGSESHFNVLVVSDAFKGLAPIARHRLVHSILADELKSHIHALSIQAQTHEQWMSGQKAFVSTPSCMGGDGSLPPKSS